MPKRGFTILELVIVVAIMLILMGAFAPALYRFIQFVRHLGNLGR